MSKAWIEDLWLTEPRETLPDGSKVKIPVPSSVTKSLAAYMKTPEKAKVPGKFKTARYGHGKRWRVSWWATLPDGSKKRSSKAFSTRADAESFAAAMEDDIRSGRYVCLCSISCCGFSHDDFSGLGRACRPRNGLNWMVLVSPPERTGKDYDQHAPSTVYPSFAAERGIRRVDRAENTCQRADGA